MAEVPENKTGVSITGTDGATVNLSDKTVDTILGAMTSLVQNRRAASRGDDTQKR